MSNSVDVDRALLGYLAADATLAALAPDGIWYDVAPMGARHYVIVSQMDHADSYVLSGYLWERILYLVKCVRQDTSPDTAAAAAQRIYELLQDFVRVEIPTYQIALARRTERQRAVEIDENSDLRWQHVGGSYEVLAAPISEPTAPVGPSYRDLVIADGAAHYWRLDETGGTIAMDPIGYAHGTISGGVTRGQPGALADGNAAMGFDGVTGKIVAGILSLPLASTLEAWVYGNDAADNRPIIQYSGQLPIFYLQQKFLTAYDGGGGGGNGATPLPDGRWNHVACVFAADGCRLYVNGVLDTLTAGARTVSAPTPLNIGHSVDNATFWLGSLDEIAIYPTALTPEQIAAHYAAGGQP